jgi:hypothetical protein
MECSASKSLASDAAQEPEVALFRDRATRAEGWLQTIHSEIEQKLIAPRSAFRTEQTLVSSNFKHEPSQPPAA